MTPYEIRTLLHIHHIVEPLRDCLVLQPTLRWMTARGLIEKSDQVYTDLVTGMPVRGSGWRCTDKGDKLVKRLCEVKP